VSKSVFSKTEPDIQNMTVEAESLDEATTMVHDRWATNGYTVLIMRVKSSEEA
jgi:hypothetical protein